MFSMFLYHWCFNPMCHLNTGLIAFYLQHSLLINYPLHCCLANLPFNCFNLQHPVILWSKFLASYITNRHQNHRDKNLNRDQGPVFFWGILLVTRVIMFWIWSLIRFQLQDMWYFFRLCFLFQGVNNILSIYLIWLRRLFLKRLLLRRLFLLHQHLYRTTMILSKNLSSRMVSNDMVNYLLILRTTIAIMSVM